MFNERQMMLIDRVCDNASIQTVIQLAGGDITPDEAKEIVKGMPLATIQVGVMQNLINAIHDLTTAIQEEVVKDG